MKLATAEAATLIRAAREDIGMTQRELAAAVGTKQSNIAAYEAGTRSLSEEMLERLLIAADYRPTLSLAAHSEDLKALGARYGIGNIRVFGSVARGEDHHSSDIDLLVDYDDSSTIPFGFGAFVSYAEELLGFGVDIVIDRDDKFGIEHIRSTAKRL